MSKGKRTRRPFNPLPGMAALLQKNMGKLFDEEGPREYSQAEIDEWNKRIESKVPKGQK